MGRSLSLIFQALLSYFALAAQTRLINEDFEQPLIPPQSLISEGKENVVERVLEKYHIPGVSVAVVNNTDIWAKGYGFSILPSEPAAPGSLWHAGSTTKAFTAAALSLLVDTGALSWSSPLRSILGDDFAVEDDWASKHLTIDDAVSHRTGLSRHDLAYHPDISTKEMIKGVRHLPMTAEPRTTFQYCNIMFTILGAVVERISGVSLAKYFTREIWAPLGMHSTFLSLEEARRSGVSLARGYYWNESSAEYVILPQMPMDQAEGAGAVISTVLDYAKWVRMLLSRDYPLSEQGHAAILKSRTIADIVPSYVAPDSLYAAGWIKTTYHGQQIVWHNGGLPGFGTLVLFLPERGFGVVVMGNGEAAQTYGSLEIVYTLVDDLLGVSKTDRRDWFSEFLKDAQEGRRYRDSALQRLYPHVPSPPLPMSLPLRAYVGKYRHPSYGPLDLSSSSAQDTLTSQVEFGLLRSRISIVHVSGEYWIATMVDEITDQVVDIFRVRFEIGINGKVKGATIDLDGGMRSVERDVWFEKEGE